MIQAAFTVQSDDGTYISACLVGESAHAAHVRLKIDDPIWRKLAVWQWYAIPTNRPRTPPGGIHFTASRTKPRVRVPAIYTRMKMEQSHDRERSRGINGQAGQIR